MKKRIKIFKKGIALVLILVLSLNSFAAIVSDNDGSAFITKAEFDSLKNNFQTQIDNYNTSIDAKIDGAIASYLAGIKLTKKQELNLDQNCHYHFPIVCLNDESWNDPKSKYYNVSIPQILGHGKKMRPKVMGTNGSINAIITRKNGSTNEYDGSTSNIYLGSNSRDGIFIWEENLNVDFSGKDGYFNEVSKTANTRKVDNVSRYVYKIENEGTGKLNLIYFNNTTPQIDNSNYNGYSKASGFIQYKVAGFTRSHITGSSTANEAWNSSVAVPEWTPDKMSLCSSGLSLSAGTWKAPTTTMESNNLGDFIDKFNAERDKQTDIYNRWDGGAEVGAKPTSRNINWSELSKRKAVYAYDAKMPVNMSLNWNLKPYKDDDAHNIPLLKTTEFDDDVKDTVVYISTVAKNSVYIAPRFICWAWPQFVATEKDDWTWESNDYFSQMRASVVSYVDSNNKTHYMDEGMFLSRIDYNGKVSFELRFNSTTDCNIDFAISKKPFGYDAVDSDKIKFKYNVRGSSATTTVLSGSDATLVANKDYIISDIEIKKGEELYIYWHPAEDEKYIELSYLNEYCVQAED